MVAIDALGGVPGTNFNPALSELMKRVETSVSVKNEDLDPEAERWSMQLFYILAMVLEGRAQDKVRVAGNGEGVHEAVPQMRAMQLHFLLARVERLLLVQRVRPRQA